MATKTATFVYSDNSEDLIVPTLYIRRAEMPKKPPEKVTILVEFKE